MISESAKRIASSSSTTNTFAMSPLLSPSARQAEPGAARRTRRQRRVARRQPERHRDAAALAARNAQTPLMGVNDFPAQGETDAATRGLGGEGWHDGVLE